MKKRIIALLLGALGLAAFADTAIPSGKAVYDVTLNITDYPELDEFGDWPVEIDLLLGQTFVGERVGVVTNQDSSISLTVRAVWDIKKMIDYSKTDAYKGGQSKIYTRAHTVASYDSQSAGGGIWTSRNAAFSFTDVTTVEGFASRVSEFFLDSESHRTMSKPSSRAETGTLVMLNALSIRLVKEADSASCVAGTTLVCTLRIRFNRPLSDAGYASVSSLRLLNQPSKGTVFDFSTSSVALSSDGCEVAGLVKVDVGSILELVNSSTYRNDSAYRTQTKLYLNGASSPIATGSNGLLAATDGQTVTDLSETVRGVMSCRDYSAAACRIVALEFSRKTADGGFFLMRW